MKFDRELRQPRAKGLVLFQALLAQALVILARNQCQAQPVQVIIIRHAEKPDTGNELSLGGQERTAALAWYFQGTPEVLKFGKPKAIFAQSSNNATSSLRPIQTVQPLADALQLTIDQSFERDDYEAMVAMILRNDAYTGKTVLICWEHKVIPKIAAALGVEDAPNKWHGESFDRTWLITFEAQNAPKLLDLPQKLMYGDSNK